MEVVSMQINKNNINANISGTPHRMFFRIPPQESL